MSNPVSPLSRWAQVKRGLSPNLRQLAPLVRAAVDVVTTCRFPFDALLGLHQYKRHGRVSHHIWDQLLRAHCFTNGRSTALLSLITRAARPPRAPFSQTGILGQFDIARQTEIAATLDRDGFYIFPEILAGEFCDGLQTFAAASPTVIETNTALRLPLEVYDPSHPVSRTYKIRELDSIQNPFLQRLIADPVFVAIAERYLGTLPAIGGIDVWWSARYGNEAGSDAAQLFHFDFDAPPAWLKLFVYVTDVGPDNGPHVYVRGSHKAGLSPAREFRSRGYVRISDEEMSEAFGADRLTEIAGRRGTVFMADTRGFHKGKFPTSGDRLVAQVIYCSPIFNDHGNPPNLPSKIHPDLATALAMFPGVFERYRRMPNE